MSSRQLILEGRYVTKADLERERAECAKMDLKGPTRWQLFMRWAFYTVFGLLPDGPR